MIKHALKVVDVQGKIWIDSRGKVIYKTSLENETNINFTDLIDCVAHNIFDDEIDFTGVVTEYNKVKIAL